MIRFPCPILLVALCFSLLLPDESAGQTAPPTDSASLNTDQTLEDLAKQLYDDPKAADEIRALNDLAPGVQPEPGKALRLPGKERQPAVSALGVAAQSVQDARLQGGAEYAPARLAKAEERLVSAQTACSKTDYSQCQKLADETWALARLARKETRERRSQKNRFAVSVDAEGATRVEVIEGDGVEVSAQNKRELVRRNHAVRVQPGKAPEKAKPLPLPPEPVLPFPKSKLVTTSIHFHWKPVPGATRYVLLISRDATGRKPVRQLTSETTSYLFRSQLEDGTYYWFLRTVDATGVVGRASKARGFQLSTSAGDGLTIENPGQGDRQKGP